MTNQRNPNIIEIDPREMLRRFEMCKSADEKSDWLDGFIDGGYGRPLGTCLSLAYKAGWEYGHESREATP